MTEFAPVLARFFISGGEVAQVALREEGGVSIFRETIGAVSYEVGLRLTAAAEHAVPLVDVVVPPDRFFVLGDNRMNAFDSRYSGFVTFTDIVGKKL